MIVVTFISTASGLVYVLVTVGQIRAYGWRAWRRFGLGTGVDTTVCETCHVVVDDIERHRHTVHQEHLFHR